MALRADGNGDKTEGGRAKRPKGKDGQNTRGKRRGEERKASFPSLILC